MSADVNSQSNCDWSGKAGLFLLAGSQLVAQQVRQAGAANINLLLILIGLSGWSGVICVIIYSSSVYMYVTESK